MKGQQQVDQEVGRRDGSRRAAPDQHCGAGKVEAYLRSGLWLRQTDTERRTHWVFELFQFANIIMNVSERNQCVPALPRSDTNSHTQFGGVRPRPTATLDEWGSGSWRPSWAWRSSCRERFAARGSTSASCTTSWAAYRAGRVESD